MRIVGYVYAGGFAVCARCQQPDESGYPIFSISDDALTLTCDSCHSFLLESGCAYCGLTVNNLMIDNQPSTLPRYCEECQAELDIYDE